jgi:leucyl aminopeptidase
MKITFKTLNNINEKDFVFVSVNSKNQDEIVKENGRKTLFIKCDEKMTLRKLFLLIRKVILIAKKAKAEKICFDFNDFKFKDIKISDAELGEIIGTQLDFANYEFIEYKSKKESTFVKEINVLGAFKETEKAILKGHTIAEEVNKTRSLSNMPGGDMTPKILAQKAKEAVKNLPVKVTVLGEKEMEKQNMRAILSVGRGSDEESKFIILEYFGGKKSEKPIVLVGKGVTFDTGGINLKPNNSLAGMNMDMSGGSAVIHVVALCAKMKLKKNVIALIPSVENMPSGKSYRPGDVIYSMSGQTIEVLNTDAEGRIILADALTYSKKYKPEAVIDVATLTGAAVVALGERASAVLTNEESLYKKLVEAGEKTGEYFWQFPLWEEYENEVKGSLGDWTNIHNKDSRSGGVIYAAKFLEQFIKPEKWLHIDMAPRMVSIPGDNLAAGAVGSPVAALVKFIEEYK